jgi:hypothetical protein
MAVIRATWFFKDDAGYGWTESLHLQSSVATLADALKAAISLGDIRRKMMGQGVLLYYIRVSDDLVRGDSMIYQVPLGNVGNTSTHAGNHDNANLCILFSFRNADGITRAPYYVRGQEDDVIQNGKYVGTASFVQNASDWYNNIITVAPLLTNPWGIKKKDPLNIPHDIIAVVQDPATGIVTITTSTPTPYAANTAITIRGMKGAIQLNGNWAIRALVNPSQFTIVLNRLMGFPTAFGSVSGIGFTIVPINSIQLRRAGHRIAGRPSDSPVGRRKRRART